MRPRLPLLLLLPLAAACPSTETPDPPTPSPTTSATPTPVPAPGWSVEPVVLAFPATAVGATRDAEIVVRNTGAVALTLAITPGTPASDAFTFTLASAALPAGATARIAVRYAPTAAGPHSTTLRVASGVAALAAIDVPVAGTTAGDTVSVSTAAVDFGDVVIGTTALAALTLTNPTDAPLDVSTATATNVSSCDHPRAADFAFCFTSRTSPIGPDGRVTLAARETRTIDLLFRPTVAGVREDGVLTWRACSGDRCPDVTHTVRFEGTGVATAIRCDAEALSFGRVGTVACADRTIVCENLGSTQRGITSIALEPTITSTAFTLPNAPGVVELAAHETVVIDVRYCPGGSGADQGEVIVTTDQEHRHYIRLTGTGGGPDLVVAPSAISFGPTAVGAPVRRPLHLTNLGDEDVIIAAIDVPANVTVSGDLATPIAAHATRTVALDLTLAAATAFTGDAIVRSNDPSEPAITVPLTGAGVALAPCVYEIQPPTLELGLVELSRSVSRAVEVRNVGTADCILAGARLLPGSDAAFSLADDPRGLTIPPGSTRAVGVTLSPIAAGARTGTLELSLSSPTAPIATVPITGLGESTPLLISPHQLDFGVIELSCRARSRPIAIYNTGTTPVPITQIRLADPPNAAFSLSGVPALTATIAPSGFIEFSVGFHSTDSAEHASAIEVVTGTGTLARTHIIGLRGRGDLSGIQVDEFSQLGEPLVDILWVIDDSGSMSEEQASLAANFLSFVRFADAQGLDYHMAITTTDVDGGERGRFVPLTGTGVRIVTPRTQPSPVTVFTANARVGTAGSGSERGLEAAYLALSNPLIGTHNAGFLRPEAALSIVYVSDEEDSSARTNDFYVDFLLAIKGAQNANTFTASAIVGDAPSGCRGSGGSATAGLRYIDVAERTGGLVQSICTPDWARALENVSTTAFGFKSRFVLSGQPVANTVAVSVDGASVPPVDAQGAQRWSYDNGANAVVFTPYATPEPGAQIRIEYRAECL